MSGTDTSLGGSQGSFPNTTWGLVSKFGADVTRHRRDNLETLCRRYWKPVYRYLRITRAKSNDDAKDLTQEFLTLLIEKDTLAHLSPERGSMRGYVRTALRHFLANREIGRAHV